MSQLSQSMKTTFAVISPDQNVSLEENNSTIYPRLNANYNDFKGHQLVAWHEFSEDWESWEMHPAGDEILVVVRGEITLLLQTEDGEQQTTLSQEGDYAVIPKGIWHTALVDSLVKVLFITPGEGTQHKN